MIKGKNLNIFVRFGGLNIKPQKGFGRDTYHAPPASRGIYAMPKCCQELFLVGSLGIFQKGTMPKDPKSWDGWEQEDFDDLRKRCKRSLMVKRKQFVKISGNIWHHLGEWIDRNEVISEHNSWVKTSIKAWQKAFSKMSLEYRYGNERDWSSKSINENRGLTGMYSKDHCEVFFDEKI